MRFASAAACGRFGPIAARAPVAPVSARGSARVSLSDRRARRLADTPRVTDPTPRPTSRPLPIWARLAVLVVPLAVARAFWAPITRIDAFRDPPDAWLLAPAAWRGLDAENLRWLFETTRAGVRQPLAWASFAVDATLSGATPAAHAGTQLVLVAGCAALLATLVYGLLALTGAARVWRWGAPVVAALFALGWVVHPLRAESIALLSARGDVLAALLGLVATIAYLTAVAPQGLGRTALAAAAIASLAAAFASPLSASFVVAWWTLGRWVSRVRPQSRAGRAPLTWPLAIVAAPPVLALIASLGVRPPDGPGSLAATAAGAGHALIAPLWDTIVPSGLHPFRDAAGGETASVPAAWWVQATIAAMLLVWSIPAALRGRGAALALLASFGAAGVAWGLGRELGGSDAGSFAATIPIYVAVAVWVGDGAGCCLGFVGAPLAAGVVLLPAWGSLDAMEAWRDDASVAARVLDVDPTNDRVRGALGDAARRRGSTAEAEAHLRRALDAGGVRPRAEAGLGALALDRGDAAAAEAHLTRATTGAPWEPQPWIDLGAARLVLGRPDDAVRALESAVRLDTESAAAWFALGRARTIKGDRFAAAEALRRALALDPADARVRDELDRVSPPPK